MIDLKEDVAVITGASQGIGAATALRFAEAGASLVINYNSNSEGADRVAELCRGRGVGAVAVRADVSRFEDVAGLFDRAISEFGRVDVLVANAGIWKGGAIDELDEHSWDETLDINLKGIYLCCHFASRIMKRAGGGRIVTVSSTAGQRGEAFHSHYAASKGGIIAFTKSLATELAAHGIRVNCVAPGWVETVMSKDPLGDPEQRAAILKTIPLGRIAESDDVAGPILFLASDLARHITGEVLNVNGGSVLCG